MEKITQEKANMLYSTDEIFKNSCYLYSTPDYDGDPNVYRWNYFYTPVQIGENIVGVRIAVRDMVKGTKGDTPESQIYNWGIKKDVSLDGGSHDQTAASSGVSSDTSNEASQLTDANSPSATSQNGSVIASINDRQLLARNGLQLPTPLKLSDSDITLSQNDRVVNNNISTGAENNSENSQTDTESGESRETFREPSTKEIYRSSTKDEDAKQRHITDIAKKLDSDMKLIWTEKNSENLNGKNGKFVRSTNTMYLAKDITVAEMYFEVFKHEFVHRLESRGTYKSFKNYLFDKSTTFEQYIRAQLKIINNGQAFEGSREEAINALTEHYYNQFINDKSLGKPLRDKFTLEDAQREITADFAGEVLFKGEKSRADIAQALSDEDMLTIGNIESTVDALEELANTDRNLFQKIIDVIKEFIRKLSGSPQTKRLVEDLEYIEQRLSRVYDSRDTKKAAKNSGEIEFSFNSIYSKESRFIVDAIYENVNNISKKDVFSVKREAIPDDIKKSEYVLNIFKEQGKIAKNSIIGEVELAQSGAKSTVFHGFGAEKLAATKAIKLVIENGNIIKKTENYNNSGVDRYVIAAKGTIESKPAYVGVIVKTYPKQKNEQAKFYLHEAVIIETDSPIMTAPQLSVDAVSESVTIDSIHENNSTVNNKSMQKSKNNSSKTENEEGQFSVGSPMQQARENLARYESGETHLGETLKDTPKSLMPESNREWSAFNRSFANQTNILKNGETKSIIIHTAEAQYLVVADGYMSGTIVVKNDIEDYYEGDKIYGSFDETGIPDFRNEKNGNRQGDHDNNSNKSENGGADSFYVELDAFVEKHSEQLRNIRQARSISERKSKDRLDESFSVGSPMQQARENLARYESRKISREEYLEENDRLWGEANEKYGTIKQGENADAPIATPKAVADDKNTERFVRTVIETGKLTPEMIEDVELEILLVILKAIKVRFL